MKHCPTCNCPESKALPLVNENALAGAQPPLKLEITNNAAAPQQFSIVDIWE
jgi:hypothetical protein